MSLSVPLQKQFLVMGKGNHAIRSSRLGLVPTHQSKPSTAVKDNGKKQRKLKPGRAVRKEIRFLRERQGLLLTRALARRVAERCMHRACEEARQDADWIQARTRRRGKTPPLSLRIKPGSDWTLSGEAVDLLRGALETRLSRVARVALQQMEHAGRMTLHLRDVEAADALVQSTLP